MAGVEMAGLTRRGMLAGMAAGAAMPALAEAPLRSPFPQARPLKVTSGTAASAETLIAGAKLGGQVSYLLADLATGAILAARLPDLPMPPASTAKVITALYALKHLGAAHRFSTKVMVTGPLAGGRLEGDLILAGGGDPTLSTDDLGDLAREIAAQGIRSVAGRLYVWAGALPYVAAIDRDQPDWLGYNPSVAGLNLNFNRVNFVWQRAAGGYEVGFDARAERFAPPVHCARMQVVDRDLPLFTYAQSGTIEDWTVSAAALGKGGSRWMPVRRPDLYAGDVFQTLMRAEGLELPAPEVLDRLPQARVLAEHRSGDLPSVLRDMMKFSTNMTAETVGMAASLKRGVASHAGSVLEMARWLAAGTGRAGAHFVDHSGLGGASRISAAGMVAALIRLGPGAGLAGLMKEVKFKDAAGLGIAAVPQRAVAKTGTLNFVSALAGYMTTAQGEERAFAIFSGDPARRDAVPDGDQENPPGGSAWLKRARHLQLQLLGGWA